MSFPIYSETKDEDIQSVKLSKSDFDATISTLSLIHDHDDLSDFIVDKKYIYL